MRRKEFFFLGRSSQLLGMIFYKLMLAIVEIMGGILCLLGAFFARHPKLVDFIDQVPTQDMLDEFVKKGAHYLIDSKIGAELLLHAGLILIALGLIKIFIALGLWFRSQSVRIAGIGLFAGLVLYSSYHLTQGFSTIRIIALISDLFFLYYFWHVLPKHFKVRKKKTADE
jgi:uncharacterized membrane protein